jgi:hypothetical protein
VFEDCQIVFFNRRASFQQGVGAQDAMSFPPAPVAHANPLGSQVAAELSDRVNYYPWDRDLICGLLQGVEFGLCDRLRRLPDPVIGKLLLKPGEPTFAHVSDGHAQQETVKQRFQLGLLRQLIRSTEE